MDNRYKDDQRTNDFFLRPEIQKTNDQLTNDWRIMTFDLNYGCYL